MKRDLIFSLALHVGVVALTLLASPFKINGQPDYDDVIQVELISGFPAAAVEPEPIAPQPEPVEITTPPALEEEPPDIPVGEPEISDEAVMEEEVETMEPEPEPPPVQSVVTETTPQPVTADDAADNGPGEIHSPATAGSSPFAGATIDNASFNYPYWFTQAFNKIRRNWRNPVAADGVIICAVYFEVIKSGKVIVIRIENSSGIPRFDDACYAAVDRAAPFPPLPRQFADEIIGITLPFKYRPGM